MPFPLFLCFTVNIVKEMAKCISTFFYSGLSPKAPGTVGSIAALPFAWFLWQAPLWASLTLLAVTYAVGTWATWQYSNELQAHDHGSIVIDEVLGIFIVTAFAHPRVFDYLVAFALFRFFDIAKPPPISWIDRRVPGAHGVMLDDIAAALFAAGMLWLAHSFLLT